MSQPKHDSAFASLQVPAFRWYVLNVFTLTLSVTIQATVVAWQVYEITHDKLTLANIALAEALPNIGASLIAGHFADVHDRRRIALWAILTLVACSLALVWMGTLASTTSWLLPAIYAVIAVSGVARAFLVPARAALGTALVPREMQPRAISVRTSTWQLGAVLGPAIGGVLIGTIGVPGTYAVDSALMVAALGCMFAVPAVRIALVRAREPMLTSLKGGLAFVFGQQAILGAISLDLFAVLFGGAVSLLPVFARDILHVGATEYGWLRASPSIGAVAMAIVLAHRPPLRRAGPALMFAVAAFGLCMIGFGLSTSLWLSIALLALSGAVDYISVVVRQSLVQLLTPDHLLGRVTAVNAIFIGSSNEIGAVESACAAQWLGTVPSVVAGGAVTLLVVAIAAWKAPALRKLREIR